MTSAFIPSSLPHYLGMGNPLRDREEIVGVSISAPLFFSDRAPPATMDGSESHVPLPLPPFSFNPGGVHIPSQSTSASPSHLRPSGHRRPSELIAVEESPITGMKNPNIEGSESTHHIPSQLPLPSGPGRRSHAHRRSAAISSVDLSALSKTVQAMPVGGSAPCSPNDAPQGHSLKEDAPRPMSRSLPSSNPGTPPASPDETSAMDRKSFWTHQSGSSHPFNRPVSIVSTETASSISTIRPSHLRVNNASKSPSRASPDSRHDIRPKTADPMLSPTKGGFCSAAGTSQLKRPVSVPDTLQDHDGSSLLEIHDIKRKKHFWDDNYWKDSFRCSSVEVESLHPPHIPSGKALEPISTPKSPRSRLDNPSPKLQKSRYKQKRMRSWAGAFFPLKGKRHRLKKSMSRKTPTPPPAPRRTNSTIGSLYEVDFDDDNTVIVRGPTNPNSPRPPRIQTNLDLAFENSWKPRGFYEQDSEIDSFSPVIDLDAALGPFNTPEMSSSRVAGSAFSIATKRMYSGGRRGEFIGPEMRYHRRAESAPEMLPFDRSALGNNRFGSNPTIAHTDVFDEEEEDAFLAGSQYPGSDEEAAHSENVDLDSRDTQKDVSLGEPVSHGILDRVPGGQMMTADLLPASKMTDLTDIAVPENGRSLEVGTTDELACQPRRSVEIIESDDWQSQPLHTSSSNASPQMVPFDRRPSTSPVDFSYGTQLSLSMDHQTASTSFPSPDPSNVSFDAPRSATASSMTDQTLFHTAYQDCNHGSLDDVPSLTSSASTVTNNRPRFSATFYPRSSEDRSAPSAPLPRRTSHSNTAKRSSLVSLSRFVGGSHGQKSKLSHEEKPPTEEAEKTKKKGRRISRLIHFWKTKEKQNLGGHTH